MDSVDSDFTENTFEEVPVPEIIPAMSFNDSAKGNIPAYTGLAILAFLGHGEDTSSSRYGPTVLRGLKRLFTPPPCAA